jgi:hypothetical protein
MLSGKNVLLAMDQDGQIFVTPENYVPPGLSHSHFPIRTMDLESLTYCYPKKLDLYFSKLCQPE